MLGKRIKLFRLNNNYSQKDLANILGVSTRSIVRWEQGKNKPNSEEIKKLSALLGISENELYDDTLSVDEVLETDLSVIVKISEGVENLVTGQEVINDTLLSTKGDYLIKQDQLVNQLQKQNEQLLLKLNEQSEVIESYRKEMDLFRLEKYHKRLRTIIFAITCLLILLLVLGTWIYYINHGFKENNIEGPIEDISESYFEINEDI